MNKLPDYKVLIFKKNENRPDIYDLQNSKFRKFTYFRLSEPRNKRFAMQGAKYIIESWGKKGEKVLFSGLSLLHGGYYFGDHKNAKTGKKSMFFVKIKGNTIILYYFNSFVKYPNQRANLLNRLVNKEKVENILLN